MKRSLFRFERNGTGHPARGEAGMQVKGPIQYFSALVRGNAHLIVQCTFFCALQELFIEKAWEGFSGLETVRKSRAADCARKWALWKCPAFQGSKQCFYGMSIE